MLFPVALAPFLPSRYFDPEQADDVEPPSGDVNQSTNFSNVRQRQGGDGNEDEQPAIDDERGEGNILRNKGTGQYSRSQTLDSTFSTSSTYFGAPPKWYLKVKQFLSPSSSDKDLELLVPNYRYTPIISGVVIPFSILLGMPGLTGHWYIRTEGGTTVQTQPNPIILNVGMAISIATALLANICLVTRFLEKRVRSMTLACIAFLTLHDLINTIAVTTFGIQRRFDDGFTYGQPFWTTICSTIASIFTTVTLIIDYYRTPSFAKRGSGLTRKQRSLMIIVIILLCYIALGALVNVYLVDLSFIDALYFTVVTIETVGLGDIVPKTTGARVFVCLYSAFGIVNIGLAVVLTRETVLEGLEVGYRQRVKAVRERRRQQEYQRRVQRRWRNAVKWRLREAGKAVWIEDEDEAAHARRFKFFHRLFPLHSSGRSLDVSYNGQPHGMRLNLEALTEAQLEAAALEAGVPLATLLPPSFYRKPSGEFQSEPKRDEGGDVPPSCSTSEPKGGHEDIPLTHARLGRMISMLGQFALAFHGSGHLNDDTPIEVPRRLVSENNMNFHRSITEQYDTFRAGMDKEERKASYARLAVAWSLFIMFWMVGSAIFTHTEGWPYGSALYFCFMTFMTIGYGDFAPVSPAGRSIFVGWALLGVGTMTILVSIISDAYAYRYKHATQSATFDKAVQRYRAKAPATRLLPHAPSTSHRHHLPVRHSKPYQGRPLDDLALTECQTRAQARLEALPHQILQHARMFHERLQYFSGIQGVDDQVPESVRNLLDDIYGAERLGERIKDEVLRDDDARQTLFTLSIELALRRMISVAEETLDALQERDILAASQQNLDVTNSMTDNANESSR